MVLELLVPSVKIRQNPQLIFIEAIFLTFLSIFCSLMIFPEKHTSISVLAFLTIGAIPLFTKLYSYDSYLYNYGKPFFQRHKTIILILAYFFLGVMCAFMASYFVLPDAVRSNVFSSQLGEISGINQIQDSITGKITGTQASSNRFGSVFILIFKNNLMVVISAALLSFLYGAGAIFLICWNASILAAVIANDILSSLAVNGVGGILAPFSVLFNSIIAILGYVPHGVPEICAYFLISVAGAVLSRDLLKGIFETEYKWKVIKDIVMMVFVAIILLVIGAIIEALYFI